MLIVLLSLSPTVVKLRPLSLSLSLAQLKVSGNALSLCFYFWSGSFYSSGKGGCVSLYRQGTDGLTVFLSLSVALH